MKACLSWQTRLAGAFDLLINIGKTPISSSI
jgi:hypothetical protein